MTKNDNGRLGRATVSIIKNKEKTMDALKDAVASGDDYSIEHSDELQEKNARVADNDNVSENNALVSSDGDTILIGQIFEDHERANKLYELDASGNWNKVSDYAVGSKILWRAAPVNDIRAWFRKLREVERHPEMFAVRGRLTESAESRVVYARASLMGRFGNRLLARLHGGNGDIVECPRHLHLIDIDDIALPAGLDIVTTPEEAVRWVIANRLPPELTGVTVVCQWSNSAALTAPPEMFKGHLWIWSEARHTSAEMKTWAKVWNRMRSGKVIDDSVFVESQPHYTAAPTLEGGADPFEGKRTILVEGDRDTVAIQLPTPDQIAEADRKTEKRATASAKTAGIAGTVVVERNSVRIGDGAAGYLAAIGFEDSIRGQIVAAVAAYFAASGPVADQDVIRKMVADAIEKSPWLDQPGGKPRAYARAYLQRQAGKRLSNVDELIRDFAAGQEREAAKKGGEFTVEDIFAEARKWGAEEITSAFNLPWLRDLRTRDAAAYRELAMTWAMLDVIDETALEQMIQKPANDNARVILSYNAPLDSAREFINRRHTRGGVRAIHQHNGDWRVWGGTHYPVAGDLGVRSGVYTFLDTAVVKNKDGGYDPFSPNAARVSNVIDALKAAAVLRDETAMPSWLDAGDDRPKAEEILACQNGLLHLPTLSLIEHNPAFFNANALEFPFDPAAPEPTAFLGFLDEVFRGDSEAVETLQDLFGLYLSTDTSHQKIALIVGPKRSGKGTLARVLTALLGRENVCSPTLASLGTNFGLMPLIGKPLAIIADARLGGKTDQAVVAERLLSISGEDAVTIDRKNTSHWTGRLPTRFLVLTNELPRLTDASGALASRFIVLQLTESFYGREDHGLTERLLGELPGILNWAIAGWQRLQRRGYLVAPKSSADAAEALEDLASPIGAFVRNRCVVSPEAAVECDGLFAAWRSWRTSEGWDQHGSKALFGRDLKSAFPTICTKQRRVEGRAIWHYVGIGLSPTETPEPAFPV